MYLLAKELIFLVSVETKSSCFGELSFIAVNFLLSSLSVSKVTATKTDTKKSAALVMFVNTWEHSQVLISNHSM